MTDTDKKGRLAWDAYDAKVQLLMGDESHHDDVGDHDDNEHETLLHEGNYDLCKGESSLMITGIVHMCLSSMDSTDRDRLFGCHLQHIDLINDHPVWLVALAFASTGDEDDGNTTLRKWASHACSLAKYAKGLSATYIMQVLTSQYGLKAFINNAPVFKRRVVQQFTMSDWVIILNHRDVVNILNRRATLLDMIKLNPDNHMKCIEIVAKLE